MASHICSLSERLRQALPHRRPSAICLLVGICNPARPSQGLRRKPRVIGPRDGVVQMASALGPKSELHRKLTTSSQKRKLEQPASAVRPSSATPQPTRCQRRRTSTSWLDIHRLKHRKLATEVPRLAASDGADGPALPAIGSARGGATSAPPPNYQAALLSASVRALELKVHQEWQGASSNQLTPPVEQTAASFFVLAGTPAGCCVSRPACAVGLASPQLAYGHAR